MKINSEASRGTITFSRFSNIFSRGFRVSPNWASTSVSSRGRIESFDAQTLRFEGGISVERKAVARLEAEC